MPGSLAARRPRRRDRIIILQQLDGGVELLQRRGDVPGMGGKRGFVGAVR
jgi:hypothetical protein